MYNTIRSYELADEEEKIDLTTPDYSKDELDALRAYVVLAEHDERQRWNAMDNKRSVDDYSQEEVSRFDHMQEVLTAYNKLLDDDDIDPALIMPEYSDIEMMEHSQYRELWIAHQCNQLDE
jgi:hypothetical protein